MPARLVKIYRPARAPLPSRQPNAAAPPKPIQPIPRDRWPAWVIRLAAIADPSDRGPGDTLARLGEKCSCNPAAANARYPFR